MLSVQVYVPSGMSRMEIITEAIETAKHLRMPVTFTWSIPRIHWTVKPDDDAEESYKALGKLFNLVMNSDHL